MRTQVVTMGSAEESAVRKLLAAPIARLRRRLAALPPEAVELRTLVKVEEDETEVEISLQLVSDVIRVSVRDADPQASIESAYEELMRRVDLELARLERAIGSRGRDVRPGPVVDAIRARGTAFSETETEAIERDVAAVERFVRRELRTMQANGEITRGEIDPRDVVEAAVERTLAGGSPKRRALFKAALSALASEIEAARQRRVEIHLEDDAPEVPPEQEVSTLGDEILDFHQPDEDLRIEDLLPGATRTPEELQRSLEFRATLREALAAAPASWRQALHLSLGEGFDDEEIADALDRPPAEIGRMRSQLRAFLRERLTEKGFVLAVGSTVDERENRVP